MVLKPTLSEIQQALRDGLGEGRASVDSIAARLHCSPSTVHRRLRRRGTTFTAERRALQIERAFGLLGSGRSATTVAADVGVSADHLCVMMSGAYGLTPRRISEIGRLADALREQPETRDDLVRFERNDARLQQLLEPIGPSHPLASWAKELVLLGNCPKYYEPEFLSRLREEEVRRRVRTRHRMDAEVVASLTEDECQVPIDVEYLLLERQHAEENMRWRSRQLQRARRNVAAYSASSRERR